MIASAEYTLNGKTYTNKIQYITERLPVGEYTIIGKANIINGESIERIIKVTIEKLDVKVIVQSTEGIKGKEAKGLDYEVEADYATPGLVVNLEVVDFDKDKLGEYKIIVHLSGNLENYNIEVVNGTYTVIQDPQFITAIIVISVFGGILLVIVVLCVVKAR